MLRDIEIAGIAALRIAARREVASIALGESLMPSRGRPTSDVAAELRSRPKRFLPGVASSEKIDDPTRPPIERVIQITQARLENQFTEDGSTRKMTPYRSQTPLRWRFKAGLAESARLPV